jgi:hypothetical protein
MAVRGAMVEIGNLGDAPSNEDAATPHRDPDTKSVQRR